jgi:hypothetical protein
MNIYLELNTIENKYPNLYEEILVVSKDKTSFICAMCVCWNEGTEDEIFEWRVDDDVCYNLDEWPYWAVFSKEAVKEE